MVSKPIQSDTPMLGLYLIIHGEDPASFQLQNYPIQGKYIAATSVGHKGLCYEGYWNQESKEGWHHYRFQKIELTTPSSPSIPSTASI